MTVITCHKTKMYSKLRLRKVVLSDALTKLLYFVGHCSNVASSQNSTDKFHSKKQLHVTKKGSEIWLKIPLLPIKQARALHPSFRRYFLKNRKSTAQVQTHFMPQKHLRQLFLVYILSPQHYTADTLRC